MHAVARHRYAVVLAGAAALFSPGCALVPTLDEVQSATTTVKDTVTGKARRDRQTQTYAEARILERRREFAAAEKLYRELLKEQPQSRDCRHRLAVMAALQGKFDEANQLYQAAQECAPPTADLLNDVGYCHYLQQQLKEAEAVLRQALALDPQHRAAMNNLALVLGEAGNFDEAYRLFRQANGDAEAEANFAFICAQCGDLQRAQQHYSRALSYNPDLRVALDGLLQVTNRMQMHVDQQAAAAPAGTPQNDPPGQVRPVSHEESLDRREPRPLIEVFVPPPTRRTASTVGTPTKFVEQVTATPQAAAVPGMPQPQSTGSTPGAMPTAPQPFSAPQMAQPQYLQPTFGPRTAPTMLASPPNSSAEPTANSGAMMNAGGPFPPLVGGASALR